nr:hypothetical protein CFP56_43730 [Quercus suber]
MIHRLAPFELLTVAMSLLAAIVHTTRKLIIRRSGRNCYSHESSVRHTLKRGLNSFADPHSSPPGSSSFE